jgi:hypothetical protein
MRPRKVAGNLIAAIILCGFGVSTHAAGLDGGVSIGGIDCNEIKRQIRRDWMELREFFRPDQEDLKRPSSREFRCISPYYTQRQIPERQRAIGLTCYNVQGVKFCCDQRKQACASL